MRRPSPAPVRGVLALALAAQLAAATLLPRPGAQARPLPDAPPANWLRAASLGEPEAAAALLMLHVQTFDDGLRWRDLDYARLAAWLERVAELDPRAMAPLAAAADVYGAVHDPARVRIMLDFIARRYAQDPRRHWPWMAQAALLARHRLHDAALAQRYAQALREHATGPAVPPWVRELGAVLAQAPERDAARIIAGGWLASVQVRDGATVRQLERRLQQIEQFSIMENAP